MIVQDLERQFFELKGKLDVGVITEEEFKAAVSKLRFQDESGHWWMIGAQSGKWYSFDGVRWIPGTPPREIPAPAPEPKIETPAKVEPPIEPPAKVEPKIEAPAPKVEPTPPPVVAPPPQPEHVAPKRIERRPPMPSLKTLSLPVSGPVLILGAAIVALIAVIVFWIVLDLVLPNRPISKFLGGLIGGQPTPTSVATVLTPTIGKEVPALIAAGDQFVLQSQMDTAIGQYQSAAQIAPQNPLPLIRLARAYAFKGLMSDAVNRAQLAVQRAPNDAEAHAQFCRALAWNSQVNDALSVCKNAIQLDAQNTNAYAFSAEVNLLARQPADAAQNAARALQLAPQNAEAHRAQAWVLTLQGQKDLALNEWKQTIALEPDLYFRHFEYAEVLRVFFNDPVNAVPEYQRALALYGGYTPTLGRLGVALIAAGKPQDAIAQLRRALTFEPTSAELMAYLGVAYGQTNQCSQAIPYFEQALKYEAGNTLAQNGLNNCKANKAPALLPITPPQVPLTPPTVTPK